MQGWVIGIFSSLLKKFCCASRLRAAGGVWRLERCSSLQWDPVCMLLLTFAWGPFCSRGTRFPVLLVGFPSSCGSLVRTFDQCTRGVNGYAQELQILIHAFLPFGLEVKLRLTYLR